MYGFSPHTGMGYESSEEAGSLSHPELSSTMQDTQKLEESSGRTFEMNVKAKPSEETVHQIEVKDAKPGKARELDTKSKRTECGGEEKIGYLVEKLTEEPTLTIAEDTSISNISPREILQAAEHPNEEPGPLASKEKVKSQEAEIPLLHEEEKTDREKDGKEGDNYQKANAGLEATDIKVKHKKSQNILSGVGSKVKHSISKVKKAITGKSSHPKTQSPEKKVQ
ncbi:titin [Quillaja saponaria]|uniref:Titin n=1 Tax=Quillaja saponaria TaxID=32244 RepID=A0AAD7VGG8_QUISA|nr:titin [Quillaja saponaria]